MAWRIRDNKFGRFIGRTYDDRSEAVRCKNRMGGSSRRYRVEEYTEPVTLPDETTPASDQETLF